MRLISFFIIILFLTFHVGSAAKKEYSVKNFKQNYMNFYEKVNSKKMSLKEKMLVWDEEIESAWPEFYDEMIHAKNRSNDWEERKISSFVKLMENLPDIHEDIVKNFDEFNATVSTQINSFKKTFPDLDLSDLEIVAAPSLLRFNGQVNHVNKEPVAGFGMDMIAFLNLNPKALLGMHYEHNSSVFYSHEIFHHYHNKKQGLGNYSEDEFNKVATLAVPLWNEGMATYMSGYMNPSASLGELFMDSALAEACVPQIEHLKREYAKIVNKKHSESKEDYITWFLLNSKNKDIPIRAGYCLGYFVAKDLVEINGLDNVIVWSLTDIVKNIDEYFRQ